MLEVKPTKNPHGCLNNREGKNNPAASARMLPDKFILAREAALTTGRFCDDRFRMQARTLSEERKNKVGRNSVSLHPLRQIVDGIHESV
jgi:hypothetical protein